MLPVTALSAVQFPGSAHLDDNINAKKRLINSQSSVKRRRDSLDLGGVPPVRANSVDEAGGKRCAATLRGMKNA